MRQDTALLGTENGKLLVGKDAEIENKRLY